MSYYINTQTISLAELADRILQRDLVPSRRKILDNLEEYLQEISEKGIANLAELLDSLKTKAKLEKASQDWGVDLDFLTLLNREVKSWMPSPNRLQDFADFSDEHLVQLSEMKIKNTKQLFPLILNEGLRIKLSEDLDCDIQIVEKWACLVDLSRIQWVNHTFAQVLYNLGYTNAETVAIANPSQMHPQVNDYNNQNGIFKGKIGLSDIKRVIHAASEVSADIQFEEE